MLLIHPQFAARTPDNKLMLAGSETDVLLMGDSKVPERALGALLKGVYSAVEVLNRGAAVVK